MSDDPVRGIFFPALVQFFSLFTQEASKSQDIGFNWPEGLGGICISNLLPIPLTG